MVKRNELRPARSENNSFNTLYASADSSSRKKYNADDVIVSLANAHENRRARQVSEWESLRQRTLRRAVL